MLTRSLLQLSILHLKAATVAAIHKKKEFPGIALIGPNEIFVPVPEDDPDVDQGSADEFRKIWALAREQGHDFVLFHDYTAPTRALPCFYPI